MNVTIRNVDDETYRKIKMGAAQAGLAIGKYIAKAVEHLQKSGHKETDPSQFLRIKPVKFGKKYRNASRMIDKWLYEEGI